MKNIIYIFLSSILTFCTVISCSKMDDNHTQFTKGGEITYSKKADSIVVYAGMNRVKISFVGLGPKVSKVRINWNHKSKSVEAPVASTNGTLTVIVPDLVEGAYSFDIYTIDKSGNISVPSIVTGNVYGENFANTLRVRTIEGTNINKGVASVDWFTSPLGSVSTEIKYTDNTGLPRTVYAPFNENITSLPKFKSGRSIIYRSLFLPEQNAIDTFYTSAATRQIIQVPSLLNKAKFANVKLPGDRWQAHLNNASWNIERAWDGITNNDNQLFHATRTGFPATITIDLGSLSELTSMKMWARTTGGALFNLGVISKFEIYGRATAPALNDGSMTGWKKIMDGNSVKPSGLPLGQTNDLDLAYALAGEDYQFDTDAEPVRYIRFKVLDNWGVGATTTYWYINEISILGFEQ